jgi:hypothetical protein
MSENTQLTSASGYNTDRIIFSESQSGSIPNSVPQINYKRINIQTRNDDGTTGDLILPTTKLFSFGVSENTNPETGKVNGYVMPICLWNRDGASQEEKEWSETFDNIVEKCKDHLIEHKDEIERYELEKRDLKKLNPLYWKKERGVVVPGTGPTLYTKLIVSKKQQKIISMFYDSDGESLDPLSLKGKYCYATCAIKIESIFIGNKISLQVKLYECEARLMDTGMRRLMKRRPPVQKRVLTTMSTKPLETQEDPLEFQEENDGISDSDDDEQPHEVKPVKPVKVTKKIVKRKVKKVVRHAKN